MFDRVGRDTGRVAQGRLRTAVSTDVAALRPALFAPDKLDVVGRQRVDTVAAGGKVAGFTVEELKVSPFYKTAVTDQNGHFTMTGIATGEYTLFSWDAMEPFAYMDPDFLKRYESQGRSVNVSASSMQTVDLKVIPGPVQ